MPKNYPILQSYPRPRDTVDARIATEILSAQGFEQNFQSETEEKTLSDYIEILRKRVRLIGFLTLGCCLLALLYAVVSPKKYSAVATLRIDSYLPVLNEAARELALQKQSTEENYFANQVAALKSYPLADRVLSNRALVRELPEILAEKSPSGQYLHSSSALEFYKKLVRISPVRDTSLVRITATASSPSLSASLANTHAAEFIVFARSDRLEDQQRNISFLSEQKEELEQKLQNTEQAIADYAEVHNLINLDDKDISISKVNEAQRMKERATSIRIEAQSRYQEAVKALKEGSTFVDDQTIAVMKQELSRAQSSYSELSQRFNAGYPKMVELRHKITSLKQQISDQREASLRSLKASFDAAMESEKRLDVQLKKQEEEAFRVAKAQVEYNRLKREYETLRELQAKVLAELQQSKISKENARKGNISLVEPAAIPEQPSSPRAKLAFALALLFGPLIGSAAGLILESLDKTIKTPEELEKILRSPALGIVPRFITLRELDDEFGFDEEPEHALEVYSPLITLREPFSVASEAFRTVRAGLRLSSVDQPLRMILISSTRQGEGKSTIVANLGVVCAQDEAKTLLIDADLRKPTLSGFFEIPENTPGLSEVLTSQFAFQECVLATEVDGLAVLPAGSPVPNPAELVGSNRMSSLLDSLRDQYDYVIVDSPPVLPVADALLLAPSVDGLLLVVRSESTNSKDAISSLSKLREAGNYVIGTILNDLDMTNSWLGRGYYSKDSMRYYGNKEKMRTAGKAA